MPAPMEAPTPRRMRSRRPRRRTRASVELRETRMVSSGEFIGLVLRAEEQK